MKLSFNQRGGFKAMRFLLLAALLLFISETGNSQVIYSYGQKGGVLSTGSGTNPTVFSNIPAMPTNIAFFYGFSAGSNSMIKASNPGLARLGDSSEAQACAGNGANQFTKFGIYRYSAQGTLFSYVKFDVVFAGDTNASTTSDNGIWYFFIGDGGTAGKFMYNDTSSKKLSDAGTAVRWCYTTNGGMTFSRYDANLNGGTWVDVTNFNWQQKKKYTIEIYANYNKNGTNVTYTRQGVQYTLQQSTMNIYVNNSAICKDAAVTQYDNQGTFRKADSYCWYGEGSNNAWIFVDNTAAADVAPTTYAYYTIKPGNGTALNLSTLSNWTSSSTGVGGSPPASFSVANSTWLIRNYTGTTGVTFTISDSLDITGGSNSQFELGDSGQVATVSLPSGKKMKGDIDIRGNGDLIIQSTNLPSIRTTDINSTVEYNNGDNNISYPLYYNLKINGGTKTLNSDYIIDGKATVGNGTNSATLIVPSNKMLIGLVDVKNNAKLTIQNSVFYPTLGTLESGSTVEYNGNLQQSVQGGQIFHHLIVNNPSGIIQYGDAIVNGTMTMASGSHNINGKNLTLNGYVAGSGATFTGSSASRIFITGTGSLGTLTFTPGNKVLKQFSVNRTSTGDVTLGSYLNVTDTLTLTDGIINSNTAADSITLGTSATSPGYLNFTQNQNYTAWINGKFQRYISQGMGKGSNNAIVFPVGSALQWGGVRLIYNQQNGTVTGGTLSARFRIGDAGSKNTTDLSDQGYLIDIYSRYAYWTVKDDGVNGTYEIDVDAFGFPGVNNEVDGTKRQNLRVLKRQDSTYVWGLEGTHSPGNGDQTRWTAKRTGLTTFSDFVLGAWSVENPLENSPLPVILSSFTSSVSGRNISLNWITSYESNNAGFEIQRALMKKDNNSNWEKAGYISGSGNSINPISYHFEDKNLNTGKYDYRLKQIDYNGNYEYLGLGSSVEISAPVKYEISQNYPNPFNPVTKIDFALPFDSRVSITIYDITGKELMTVIKDTRTAGYYKAEFDGSSLSSGVYFYRIIAESKNDSYLMIKKMVLIK